MKKKIKKLVTENSSEQWIVDRLALHEGHDVGIEVLEDEVLLSCHDCQEVVLNFLEKGGAL